MLIDMHIHSIGYTDDGFPAQLKKITNPPSFLYYRGDFSLANSTKILAVIGTRTPTQEGIDECKFITKWFVEREFVIVSGLAQGIDTITHETCLKYDGRTIVVLPSGIENIYPKENKELSEKIVERGGLLLSEYPKNTPPRKLSFIHRDRIQSGLSFGVIVIESEILSGTMYTAKFTLQQNRFLGCVTYSDIDNVKRSGNRELLNSGKAFRINRETLRDFEGKLLVKS